MKKCAVVLMAILSMSAHAFCYEPTLEHRNFMAISSSDAPSKGWCYDHFERTGRLLCDREILKIEMQSFKDQMDLFITHLKYYVETSDTKADNAVIKYKEEVREYAKCVLKEALE